MVNGGKQDSLGATTSLGSSREMDEWPWVEGDESGEAIERNRLALADRGTDLMKVGRRISQGRCK